MILLRLLYKLLLSRACERTKQIHTVLYSRNTKLWWYLCSTLVSDVTFLNLISVCFGVFKTTLKFMYYKTLLAQLALLSCSLCAMQKARELEDTWCDERINLSGLHLSFFTFFCSFLVKGFCHVKAAMPLTATLLWPCHCITTPMTFFMPVVYSCV